MLLLGKFYDIKMVELPHREVNFYLASRVLQTNQKESWAYFGFKCFMFYLLGPFNITIVILKKIPATSLVPHTAWAHALWLSYSRNFVKYCLVPKIIFPMRK